MKKLISVILCLMMVLALATPAFAEEGHTHTITIMNSVNGYTYKAYQVFSADLSADGKLSNIDWGKGINAEALLADLQTIPAYEKCGTAKDVAAILAKDPHADNETAQAFAEIVANHLNEEKVRTATYTNGKYTVDVQGDGYYLVVNTAVPEGTDTTYSRHVLEVVRNVTVSHKGSYPTVEKRITDNGERVTLNEASVGDAVRYDILGTIPVNIGDYDSYFYCFTDTLSKGLTYDKNMTITVNDVDVTKYFNVSVGEYNANTGTTITAGIQDLLALELVEGVGKITKDTKILLIYTATLNENAIIGNAEGNIGNQNKVYLEYSNNPNDDGVGATNPPPENPGKPTPQQPTGQTPEKEVTTYTTELVIQKVDGQGNALTGAEFELTGEGVNVVVITGQYFEFAGEGQGEYYKLTTGAYTKNAPVYEDDPETKDIDEKNNQYYATETADYNLVNKVTVDSLDNPMGKVKAFVDENGQVKFTGLGVGTYTITETTTPQGYNDVEPITFSVTFDHDTKLFISDNTQVMVNGSANSMYSEVVNISGSTLPSTGGTGTTLFYIFGSILFTSAVVLLITKKRMAQ